MLVPNTVLPSYVHRMRSFVIGTKDMLSGSMDMVLYFPPPIFPFLKQP